MGSAGVSSFGTGETLQAMGFQEPPEAQSVRSMLHIARIVAVIFGIIWLLVGLADLGLTLVAAAACNTTLGTGYCGPVAFLVIFPILAIIWAVLNFVIYVRCRSIEALVNQRQYERAKSDTLIWMILGFIIGGIIIGIILLVAWLKFDPLITAQRNMAAGGGQMPPPMAPPPMAPLAAPMAAAAPGAPPASGVQTAPFCGTCGKPTTYIPQYGRYYCYDCKQYV
jgi:hypothetical protein